MMLADLKLDGKLRKVIMQAPKNGFFYSAVGGLKDLRFMTTEVHADYLNIVLGGTRTQKGMASFADVLKEDEAEAIHHYLIARSNEDWGLNSSTGVEAGTKAP